MDELISKQATLEALCHDCRSEYAGYCPNPSGRCHEYTLIKNMQAAKTIDSPMRLIDYNIIREYCEKHHTNSVPVEYLKQIPVIFANPPKKGRWNLGNVYGTYHCSICDAIVTRRLDECPNCGADMRGG